jgi:hypothetical protein
MTLLGFSVARIPSSVNALPQVTTSPTTRLYKESQPSNLHEVSFCRWRLITSADIHWTIASRSPTRMAPLWRSVAIAAAFFSLATSELLTPKHEAGRCAIRGTCGSSSWFSPALPCPDNGLAEDPKADVREKLVELCGPKWSTGQVCCKGDQVWSLIV